MNPKMVRRRKSSGAVGEKRIDIFSVCIYLILGIWALLIILPFLNVLVISITTEGEYVRTPLLIFPQDPTFDSYKALFADGRIWIGYRTTLIILCLGLPVNMFLTVCTAYALSRPPFPGKKFLMLYALFTMFFSGGIVPLYLLIKSLSLTNTIWSVVLASGINTFYFIIMRNYFMSLPEALVESAKIDGANEWTILFRIILPLSAPIIATVTLFYAVDRWNEWFNAMVFIRNTEMTPLQLVLRSIVIEAQMVDSSAMGGSMAASESMSRFAQGMKMAAVFVTMAPIMVVYPFLQKYFVKGVLVGAIKA